MSRHTDDLCYPIGVVRSPISNNNLKLGDVSPISGWLKTFSASTSTILKQYGGRKEYEGESLICSERDPPKYVFLIEQGIVRLEKFAGFPEKKIIHFGKAGEIYGIAALFSYQHLPYSIMAHTPCRVFLLPAKILLKAAGNDSQFLLELLKHVNNLINDLEYQRACVCTGASNECLLNAARYLKNKFGMDASGKIALHLTGKQLANYIGISRPHLYYLLQRLDSYLQFRRGYLWLKEN